MAAACSAEGLADTPPPRSRSFPTPVRLLRVSIRLHSVHICIEIPGRAISIWSALCSFNPCSITWNDLLCVRCICICALRRMRSIRVADLDRGSTSLSVPDCLDSTTTRCKRGWTSGKENWEIRCPRSTRHIQHTLACRRCEHTSGYLPLCLVATIPRLLSKLCFDGLCDTTITIFCIGTESCSSR